MKAALLFDEAFGSALSGLRKVRPDNLAATVKIKKMFIRLEQETKIFEEARKEALEELSEKDTEGNAIIESGSYRLSKEANIKMAVKMQALVNVEIDIEKIKISELGDLTKIQGLSVEDLFNLEAILSTED